MLRRWAVYTTPATAMTAGQLFQQQAIRIDSQPGPFVLRGVTMRQDNNFAIRMRRPDGRYFQSDLVNSNNIDTGNVLPRPLPIYDPIVYPFASLFSWDVECLSDGTYAIVLIGEHLIDEPGVTPYPSDDPLESEYVLRVLVTVGANATLSVPLQVPFDTPFAIRALSVAGEEGAAISPAGLGIQIRDADGRSYMNDFVDVATLFQSTSTAWPGTPNPELLVPSRRAFRLDFQETAGNDWDLEFAFGGALLYAR